jgi:hypothetical protein
MSWLFSRALAEEYSAGICSDGEPCAPSNLTPMPLGFCSPDKMMDVSRLSRYGTTFAPLTDDRGEAVLMSFLAAFPVRTSALPEQERESTASEAAFGESLPASFARFDRASCSWRTPQPSLFADLAESSVTWPRWGSMRNGVCWERTTLALRTVASGYGFWPTPNARDWKDSGESQGNRKTPNLGTMVHLTPMWPTPRTAVMCGGSGAWDMLNAATTQEEARLMGAGNGGLLNPTWVEWLMGWPLGWTDLGASATGKFRLWRRSHGAC